MDAVLLAEYVARHNRGLSSGDFSPMLELFHLDAEMHFVGLPVGPYVGRKAIGSAFADNPPDDELVVMYSSGDEAHASAEYRWSREPARAAGTLDLELRSGRIARLTVTVGS